MQEGTVKFFNESKGYGFITDDATNQEIFVHVTGLNQGVMLRQNDRVSFEIRDGKKGLNAVEVSKIS